MVRLETNDGRGVGFAPQGSVARWIPMVKNEQEAGNDAERAGELGSLASLPEIRERWPFSSVFDVLKC